MKVKTRSLSVRNYYRKLGTSVKCVLHRLMRNKFTFLLADVRWLLCAASAGANVVNEPWLAGSICTSLR